MAVLGAARGRRVRSDRRARAVSLRDHAARRDALAREIGLHRGGSGLREPQVRRGRAGIVRSEEHTSELQSLAYLVCRLLLEKKKKTTRHKVQGAYVSGALLEKMKHISTGDTKRPRLEKDDRVATCCLKLLKVVVLAHVGH